MANSGINFQLAIDKPTLENTFLKQNIKYFQKYNFLSMG